MEHLLQEQMLDFLYYFRIHDISKVSKCGIRHFYPQADTLRLHLTLTLWVQCIVHLRSTF